jgi:exonuclease III
MKPEIVSWNVRGLNEKEKRLKIRGLLRDWKANIICLQETKLDCIYKEVIRSLCGYQHVDSYLGSREASGGILLMWDRGCIVQMMMLTRNVFGMNRLAL